MNQKDVFARVIDILNELKISYMIVGSIASILYGKPRLTLDMDIVIDIKEEDIEDFVSKFDSDWYIDKEMIKDAISRKFYFNIIHIPSANKIDFFLLQDDDYAKGQFKRRKAENFDEVRQAFFSCVEDIIIKKLDYYLEGKSEKHIEDIMGILRTYPNKIDFDYLQKWAKRKGTFNIWKDLKERGEESN